MPTIDEIMRLIVPTTDSTVAEVRAAIESAIAAAVAAERDVYVARIDEMSRRLLDMESRYMALLKSVADGVALQPHTVMLNFGPDFDARGLLSVHPAQREPLTDEQCDSIYSALNEWAQNWSSYEFGLPISEQEGGREVIRRAIERAITGQSPKE